MSAHLHLTFFLTHSETIPTHSRDDKRYTEKKNKSERARRKKEDTARLRQIVDVALNCDPRIKRIKPARSILTLSLGGLSNKKAC